MKIRTQFNLLIVGIVIIPILSLVYFPLHRYLTSPQRYLLKGYEEVRKLSNFDFTEDDWEAIENQIKNMPPDVETLIYYDSRILISNIPELKSGMAISPVELFEFMKETGDEYDYQFQSPIKNRKHIFHDRNKEKEDLPFKILVICRAKISDGKKQKFTMFTLSILIAVLIFECFCITFIIFLSHTIFSSITLLEQSTQKIANGAFDTKIEKPNNAKRQSNEITSLAESLEKMRATLKDDQERRIKFIMGISHDLRTPVALIKGYAEAIVDGVVNTMDAAKKSIAIIQSKADQLENMINDLINYVKLNNTDWQQTLEPVQIGSFLKNFAQSVKMTEEVYKRNIDISIDVDANIMIPMDKNLVNRALENIFSNAVRYTKGGDSISVTAVQKQESIEVSIADTGIGIAEKDLEHIYDIFYRGTNSRRERGMGIGLSVVKTIVDTLDWKIDVSSKIGEGTTFTIKIPLAQDKNPL